MWNTRFPVMPRVLALWLALALAWPSPTFALRPRASGVEEPTAVTQDLTQRLAPASHTTGLEEEWGEAVWNRLYEIRELEVRNTVALEARDHLRNLIRYSWNYQSAERGQAWRRLAETLSPPALQAAAQMFGQRKVALHELHGNVLWEAERQEGILLVGGSGVGKSTVTRALTDSQPKNISTRWEFLADDWWNAPRLNWT